MTLTDSRGLPVSTDSVIALERYELAMRQTLGYVGNPLEALDEALAEDPDFGGAHALRADLAVMSSEQGALPLIQASVEAMGRRGTRATPRDQAHVAAAQAWLEGRFERAVQLYGMVTLEYPRDLIAIQAAHIIDFYLGDSIMLRDHVAQAMPYWNVDVPGFGYLLGMHAFGLEENANFARAEDVGRHALSINARDPWAVHAVQHVLEMQGRVHDGIEWLNATSPNWADSALAFHNWWHLALHQLELGDIPAALDVYDRLVHPKETAIALELVDASQLLARIALRGGAVGARWDELAKLLGEGGRGRLLRLQRPARAPRVCVRWPRFGCQPHARDARAKRERLRHQTRRTRAPSACRSPSRSWRWPPAGRPRRSSTSCRSAAARTASAAAMRSATSSS
jgi:tetratricopeptide (TPR) repeat protein